MSLVILFIDGTLCKKSDNPRGLLSGENGLDLDRDDLPAWGQYDFQGPPGGRCAAWRHSVL